MTNKEKERDKIRRAKALLKKQNSPTYLKKKADSLFHALVKKIGWCESGREKHKGPLQCAHGFSRSHISTRWDVRNAWALCAGCHLYYGRHRVLEWDEWMQQKLGLSAYLQLRHKALYVVPENIRWTIERLEHVTGLN